MIPIFSLCFRTTRSNGAFVHYGEISRDFQQALDQWPEKLPWKNILEPSPFAGGRLPDTLRQQDGIAHIGLLMVPLFTDVEPVLGGLEQTLKHARIDWLKLPDVCLLPGMLPRKLAQIIDQNFCRVTLVDSISSTIAIDNFDAPITSPDHLLMNRRLLPLVMPGHAANPPIPKVTDPQIFETNERFISSLDALINDQKTGWVGLPQALFHPGALPLAVCQKIETYFMRYTTYAGMNIKFEMNSFLTQASQEQGSVHWLVHRRLASAIMTDLQNNRAREWQDNLLNEVISQFKIPRRGILHVGANVGQEIPNYLTDGYAPIILVEANPDLSARLEEITAELPQVQVINRAALDKNGSITLNITGNDQGSSVLAMSDKGLQEFGSDFHVVKTVEVQGQRLDDMIADAGIPADAFSILYLDIQGAEAMALRGAEGILSKVDLVLSEINFVEHYDGCAQIEDIDILLEAAGFDRVALDCSYSTAWGDGIYVRRSLLPS